MLRYKGYTGKVEFDDEAEIFHGEVCGLPRWDEFLRLPLALPILLLGGLGGCFKSSFLMASSHILSPSDLAFLNFSSSAAAFMM